jgi:hypothetical protein
MTQIFKAADYDAVLARMYEKYKDIGAVAGLAKQVARYKNTYPSLVGAPTEWLLAYIRVESGGIYKTTTSLNERGYFQVMRSTARDLKWSDEKFMSLTTDPDSSMKYGLEAVAAGATSVARAMSLGGPGADKVVEGYWNFVKLYHGLPLLIRAGVIEFRRVRGHYPKSWAESRDFCLSLAEAPEDSFLDLRRRKGADWRAATPGILMNAELTGKVAEYISGRIPKNQPIEIYSEDNVRRTLAALADLDPFDAVKTKHELQRVLDSLNNI